MGLRIPPDQGNTQEPSIWDQAEALSYKRRSVWDEAEAIGADPAKQQTNFILQQGAVIAPEKAARIIRVARTFKLPEPFVEKNLETLETQEKQGALASQDLVENNPAIAEAISKSPNYSAAALKHLPALKQLEMLYTRPPELWPLSDKTIQDQARRAAKLLAERHWTGSPRQRTGFEEEGGADAFYASSKEEMEDIFYKRELADLTAEEQVISQSGEIGGVEAIRNLNRENPVFFVPFLMHVPGIFKKLGDIILKEKAQAGSADELDRYYLNRAARLESISNMRGKSFMGQLGEGAAQFPAMAGEMMAGGMIGRGASALFGLSGKTVGQKAAMALLESAVASGAGGSMQTAEAIAGGQNPAQAALSTLIDYSSAHLFGPWFSKATPEAQVAVKKSLLAAIPLEAGKFVGMTEAAQLLKGLTGIEPLQIPDVAKALGGDAEAAKRVGAQAVIGGFSGLGHTVLHNSRLYADAALARGKILEEIAKENPELAADMARELAAQMPNPYTYVPSEAVKEYADVKHSDPQAIGSLLGADYEHSIRSGAALMVPTSVYDHAIGTDPEASKFFAEKIRPEPGGLSAEEASRLEKAYNAGLQIEPDARKRIIGQIVEQAKGDKTREAVAMARLDQGGEKLIADPKLLGLSEEQQTKLSVLIGKAHQAAEEAMNAKELARRERLKSDLYAKERERVQEQVTHEIDARPEQIALARLQKGTDPNGTPLPEGMPKFKLSRQALKKDFPSLSESSLPKGVVADENIEGYNPASTGSGIHPDEAAAMLGFDSGDKLLTALVGTDRAKAIEETTKARMEAKYPGGLQTWELPQEAVQAIHNKHSAELQRSILKAIVENKLTRDFVASRKVPGIDEIRERQAREIARMPPERVNPDLYLDAEQRANREVMEAAAGRDFEGVFDAKLRALEAHEAYRAAMEVKEKTGRIFAKWAKIPDSAVLNKPEVFDYGQQAKDFLRRIGFAAVDPKELATKKPFTQWAKEKLDSGESRMETIYRDPRFAREDFTANYKDLSYQDIKSLEATLDQIVYLAKDKNQAIVAGNKIAIDSAAGELAGEIKANFEPKPMKSLTEDSKSIASGLRSVDAWLDSPEAFFDRLGGRKKDSAWNKLFADQVEARIKYDALRRRYAQATKEVWDKLSKEDAKAFDRKVTIPGVKVPLSLREIACIACNGGNESNYQKMVRGETMRGEQDLGLTEEKIQEAVTHLSESQKDHVQRILDITNMFWKEIEALHVWATGAPPKKIEAKQMLKAMGDRPGGYYPAMYDRSFSKQGEMQVERDSHLGQILPPSFVRATTDAGYRETRVEEFAAPMDFNFGRLASHMDSMIKDIAFRPWLIEANKLASRPEVKDALRDRVGPEYRNFVGDWMKRVIHAGNHPSDGTASRVRRWVSAIRHNVTIAVLGLRPATILHHTVGVDLAIAEVGAKNYMDGLGQFWSNPKETIRQMVAEAPDLAHYGENSDPNIRASVARLEGKSSAWADFQRFTLAGIGYANLSRAVPTYFAAKAKALGEMAKEGKVGPEAQKTAIEYAQRTVRTTVGSAKPGDLPAVMTSDFAKMMLMFYTPGRLRYAQMKNAWDDLKRGGVDSFIFKAFWMLPAGAILHAIVSGKMPDEDKDETYLGMYAKDMATYSFSPLPLGQEIAQNAVDIASGKSHSTGHSSPIFKGLEQAFDTLQKTEKWHEDEAEFEDVFRSFSRSAGYLFGAPTEQLEISAGYLLDLERHKGEDPNDLFEFMHDFLWRRPKSRR